VDKEGIRIELSRSSAACGVFHFRKILDRSLSYFLTIPFGLGEAINLAS
jgi:hypothetical protein